MDSQLASNLEELEKMFASRMREYEDKIQKATSGSKASHSDIASLSSEFLDFKTFVCQTLSAFKKQLNLLSHSIDRHETIMRRRILLIHGLAEKPNEKLLDSVIKLISTQMKVPDVKAENIHVCHRLGLSQASMWLILVSFSDMEYRTLIWDNKSSLKSSSVTISEFLTKTRHKVFILARKHFGIHKCWSSEGKIHIILPDKSGRKIECIFELLNLMAQYPESTTGEDAGKQGNQEHPKNTKSKSGSVTSKKTRRYK